MLNVFDVSAIVHTAMSNAYYRDEEWYGIPVGGIRFLSMYLCNAFLGYHDVILCFDSPCFRASEFLEYKKGRTKNMAVILQLEVIYEQLQKHGIKCLKLDGYEADDLIAWAVAEWRDDYDTVAIYSNDLDLCHCIRDNVRLRSVRADVNSVNCTNFPNCIIKGEYIPFNTISAYKVFCGCDSDKIPVMRLDNGMHGKQIYRHFLKFCELTKVINDYTKTSNPGLLSIYAKFSNIFSEHDKELLEKRVRLVYPAVRPQDFVIEPFITRNADTDGFSHFLTMFNVSRAFGSDSLFVRKKLSEKDKNYLREVSGRYVSGESFADNNINYSGKRLSSSTLKLDSFTKDF